MNALLLLQRLVPAVGLAANAVRCPGVRCGLRVEIAGPGSLRYGASVSLGQDTRIDLPAGAALDLEERVSVSRNVHIAPEAGRRIRVGAATTVQDGCRIYGDVSIGRNCIFAPNVFISSGTHAFDTIPDRLIQEQDSLAPVPTRPIRIFSDCWLGINSVIVPGVTIGRGCVVGANSVVTDDLEPYSIAVGSPARVVRRRLQFAPKSRIDAASESDPPYFYDGFAPTKEVGALSAEADFTIALDHDNPRAVRLCLSGEGSITFDDRQTPLPKHPDIIEFSIRTREGSLPLLTFRVDGRCVVRWAELI
jgi:acetyltransferase-like isoleucine patch superfamily enzyme